ncbi:MAG TPA: hypothetical protein VJU14_07105, partial [Solirubrobacterales bacterium]|nr:hypothetical protein [Solirubrobacterales bacterium]
LVLAGLVGGALVAAGPEADGPAASEATELPRGGSVILPRNRVVAFYGAPRDPELGTLGIGSPDRVARRLERQASQYARPGRPVLPAFELISTLVTQEPGEDGNHALHEEASTVRRYLRAARAHEMLLILDVQPGYASFLDEARRLEPFLRQPEVSLALDPEWSMDPPQLPGQEIGSTDAETINSVSRYLSDLVRRHDLPQKLLVVHRFTEEMVESEEELERHPGVALVVNVDGFGDQPNKIAKYGQLARERRSSFNGFKLFYEEDVDLMEPEQVLRLRPQPALVVYE